MVRGGRLGVKVRRRGADEKADYMQMARVPCGYIYPPPQEQDWAVRPKYPLTRFDSKGRRERRTPQAVTPVLYGCVLRHRGHNGICPVEVVGGGSIIRSDAPERGFASPGSELFRLRSRFRFRLPVLVLVAPQRNKWLADLFVERAFHQQ